jgi:ribosomal protein S18 acetylase RimI-like enzyme
MRVREASPEEHDHLGSLCVRAYRSLGAVSESYAARLRDVRSRAQTARVLAAVDDGAPPLGCVTLILDGGPWRELAADDEAEFRMLAVDPAAQGRGAGAALVRACIEQARTAGRARPVLSSATDMAAAHRLYERLGFTRAPSRDWKPAPHVQLLAYELAL